MPWPRSRALALSTLALLACSSSTPASPAAEPASSVAPPETVDAPASTPASTATAPRLQGLTLSVGDLVPAFDPSVAEYTVTANTSLFPIDVTATADATATVTVNGQPAIAGAPATVQLAPRQDLVVKVSAGAGESTTYTVHYMNALFPAYAVNGTAAGSERILLTPDERFLFITNRAGDPLYYRYFPPVWVTDFKQHVLPGGKVLYSYAESVPPQLVDGRIHLLDDHLRETATLALLPNRDHGALDADLHDFLVLGEEHYVLVAYRPVTLDLSGVDPSYGTAATVVAGVVQEIDHGAVVFEWESTDVPSLYADSVDGNVYDGSKSGDYVHLNSVAIDPADDNFIVSLRHTDSVLKLDRKTGATIWTLGGRSDAFDLEESQKFSHQHHVRRLEDGTLLVFDNGNNAHPTRTLALQLDEAAKKVTSYATVYARPEGQFDSTFMGSIFRMDTSRYIIGWGGHTSPTTTGPAVTEIVDGAPVWSLTFTTPTIYSYRAFTMP